ncbi:MAG: hypothetical protein KDN19_06130 [Verrucomicrobiae bacterium]|nr:hypothetical protein [Verrucomicrobiae bacterium]
MSGGASENDTLTSTRHRVVTLMLRSLGAVSCSAFFAVMMPHAWMDRIHQRIGLGELPDLPMVAYLSRSLSLFYAWLGILVIWTSFEVDRHWRWIRVFAFTGLGVAIVQTAIDFLAPVPTWWLIAESGFLFGYFGLLAWLTRS